MFFCSKEPSISSSQQTINFFANIIKDLDFFLGMNKNGTAEAYKIKMNEIVISLKCFKEMLVVEEKGPEKLKDIAREPSLGNLSMVSTDWEVVEEAIKGKEVEDENDDQGPGSPDTVVDVEMGNESEVKESNQHEEAIPYSSLLKDPCTSKNLNTNDAEIRYENILRSDEVSTPKNADQEEITNGREPEGLKILKGNSDVAPQTIGSFVLDGTFSIPNSINDYSIEERMPQKSYKNYFSSPITPPRCLNFRSNTFGDEEGLSGKRNDSGIFQFES